VFAEFSEGARLDLNQGPTDQEFPQSFRPGSAEPGRTSLSAPRRLLAEPATLRTVSRSETLRRLEPSEEIRRIIDRWLVALGVGGRDRRVGGLKGHRQRFRVAHDLRDGKVVHAHRSLPEVAGLLRSSRAQLHDHTARERAESETPHPRRVRPTMKRPRSCSS
jgi:hypothetical protein